MALHRISGVTDSVIMSTGGRPVVSDAGFSQPIPVVEVIRNRITVM